MICKFSVILLLVALASQVVLAADKEAAPIDRKGERKQVPERKIGVRTPNGWWLEINGDGSGHVGYGSSLADSWSFRTGTFSVEKVTKDLRRLTSDEKGKMSSHFVFHFESERKAPDRPGPARYSRDLKVIPALFERATEEAQVKKQDRGGLLLKKYPPGLPK
jgi:hypothetical protein